MRLASILVLVLLSVSCQSIQGPNQSIQSPKAKIKIYPSLAEARAQGCPARQILARPYKDLDDDRIRCVPKDTEFCEGPNPKYEKVGNVYSIKFCDPEYERVQ